MKGRKAEFRGNINHVYYFALFSGDYPLLCKREGQKEIDSRAAVDISRVNSLPRLHTPPHIPEEIKPETPFLIFTLLSDSLKLLNNSVNITLISILRS